MHFQKPMLGVPLDWSNPLNKGLVMHLAMNEGHGDVVRDLSMNGNHGTLKNMAFPSTVASGWNPGRTGIGLNFDGVNDYVDCGNGENLDFDSSTQDFSLSLIFKIETNSSPGDILICKRDANDDGFRIALGNCGTIYASLNEIDAHDSTAHLNTGWHNVVAVFDRDSDIKLYVDSVYKADKALAGQSMSTSANLTIGKSAYDSSYYNGIIDAVRIYNRALTAKEVKDYYINPWQVYLDEDD